MDISFFIIGGVIFATYIAFTLWNIFKSNEIQKDQNYPNVKSDLFSSEKENKSDL